jgi:hypothetical protein
MSFLVLGAGELGLAVIESLRKHDANVSVLVRQTTDSSPEKKQTTQRLRDLGVGFETADVVAASVSELASVFRRYHTVVSCNGMGLPAGTQVKLTEAAIEAEVARYVPWQFGMDYDVIGQGSSQDLFDEQLRVRAILRGQSNVEWIIFSTGVFMSFLFLESFGIVDLKAKTVHALGSWDNRITATTPEDIGTVVADVLLDPRGIRNQVVFTAGDTVSYAQVADLVDARFGRFDRELWDLDALKQQLENDGSSIIKYRETFAQGRGVAWDKEKTVNHERGIPMTNVQMYLNAMKN